MADDRQMLPGLEQDAQVNPAADHAPQAPEVTEASEDAAAPTPPAPPPTTSPSPMSSRLPASSTVSSAARSPASAITAHAGSSDSARDGAPSGQRLKATASAPGKVARKGSKVNQTPGAELERRVARLEFAEGALTRLRVPVHVDAEAGRDVLTDLDVLAVDVDNRLRLSRSILECKSGKGQSGEGDRLLWLVGLEKFIGVDRAVLVRQTITRRGRFLAGRLGVQILDVATLTVREAANAWVPDRFAHVDGPGCAAAEARMDAQLKGLGHIPGELVTFLRHKSLLEPSDRALPALAALGRIVEKGGVLPDPTRTVLAGHALQTLVLAAISDAARLDTTSTEEVKRRIELALTVGTPDDDHVLSVLGRADVLMGRIVDRVHRTYIDAGAERRNVAAPSLRQIVAEPPVWIDRYLELIARLRANPLITRDLPQTVELACFDALVGDQSYRARAFDHLFTAEHRHLLLAAVRSLRDSAGTQLAEALAPLGDLDFTRAAPALPDRTSGSPSSYDPERRQS